MTTPHTLAPLPFAPNALEPHIDAKTVEIHHDKHQQTYVDNLNKALADPAAGEFADLELEELLYTIEKIPAAIQTPIRNNAGGVFNHTLYWNTMKEPAPSTNLGASTADGTPSNLPVGLSAKAIDETFGSFAKFQEAFTKAALTRFGSGWAWLILNEKKSLQITSTPNQDCPLMKNIAVEAGLPILTLDVWEHSYYLKYQNRRADYVKAWWNVINWEQVENYYRAALQAMDGEGCCGGGGCGDKGCGCDRGH